MKFSRIVDSTSGAPRHSRSAVAIDAHNAPAIIAAIRAGIVPNGDAMNAARPPTMNCPSAPMFQAPARNAAERHRAQGARTSRVGGVVVHSRDHEPRGERPRAQSRAPEQPVVEQDHVGWVVAQRGSELGQRRDAAREGEVRRRGDQVRQRAPARPGEVGDEDGGGRGGHMTMVVAEGARVHRGNPYSRRGELRG